MLHRSRILALPVSFVALALSACAQTGPLSLSEQGTDEAAPQSRFWQALSSHCGNAYQGRLVGADDPRDADFAGRRLVAHWAQCSSDRIAIALHVEDAAAPGGWDRSRTWVVTDESAPFASGIRLKHDHRHADGSEDAVTQYGGDTTTAGTARAQDFPMDSESVALFEREGLDVSVTNVWRMEVDPAREADARFAYQLTRTADPTRRFRAEFDASEPVATPPPAWGW